MEYSTGRSGNAPMYRICARKPGQSGDVIKIDMPSSPVTCATAAEGA